MKDADELTQILKSDCFNLFQLTPAFDINIQLLNSLYLELQKKYHPDKANNNQIQALYLAISAHINEAYTQLKNPLTRALFLLKLKHHPLDLAHDTSLPHEFLMEQMEFHEALEEATQTHNIEALEQLEQMLHKKEHTIILELSHAFNKQQFDLMQNLCKQLAFYQRLLNHTDEAINSIT